MKVFGRTEVKRDDLVVGDEYFDTAGCLGEKMVYVGVFEYGRYFYSIDPCYGYAKEGDGCLLFNMTGGSFYEEVE